MRVDGTPCWVIHGLEVACGVDPYVIPAMPCVLPVGWSSFGLSSRARRVYHEKELMVILVVVIIGVFSRLDRFAAHRLLVLAGGVR